MAETLEPAYYTAVVTGSLIFDRNARHTYTKMNHNEVKSNDSFSDQ